MSAFYCDLWSNGILKSPIECEFWGSHSGEY